MIGLLVIAIGWVLLVVAVIVQRSLGRVVKLCIVVPLLAYGALSAVSLVRSYSHARTLLDGFDARQAEAARHMASALAATPDTVLREPLALTARRLQDRLADAAAAFGPRTWNVVWKYRIIPAFEADILATNLVKLVDVPPQLVYAGGRYARHNAEIAQCADYHQPDFPMLRSMSLEVMWGMMDSDAAGHEEATRLCDAVDLTKEDAADPRSNTYRLVALAARMVGAQNKMEELLAATCGAFDQFLALKVRRVYLKENSAEAEWSPYSALLMDFGPLVASIWGMNMLEVRWMGDPPRPVVGSADVLYRIECEVTGPWPEGQATWSDPETGASGPVYFADLATSRVFTEGVRLSKWPEQPDFRSIDITASLDERHYSGIPSIDVGEDNFLPPKPERPRR